jgi:RNA-directed DNA polymerase
MAMTNKKKKKKPKTSRTKISKRLKLEDCYLYAIASPADLAARLHSSVAELEKWANSPKRYNIWTTEKGRKIQEPKPELQRIHGRVHELLSRVEPPSYLHSSVRAHSYITNARQHISAAPAVKFDIKKFFPSVKRHAVFQFFYQRMRCARDVAGLFARLLTCDDRLATGSRASPILAYYCFKDLFDELHAAAIERNLVLTCYVDDITVTGNGAARYLPIARSIIAAHGLRSHKVKSFRTGEPRVVTGVVVTPRGLRVPHQRQLKIKQAYDLLHRSEGKDAKLSVLPSLISRVHEAAQIDPGTWIGKARELERFRSDLDNGAAQGSPDTKTLPARPTEIS